MYSNRQARIQSTLRELLPMVKHMAGNLQVNQLEECDKQKRIKYLFAPACASGDRESLFARKRGGKKLCGRVGSPGEPDVAIEKLPLEK